MCETISMSLEEVVQQRIKNRMKINWKEGERYVWVDISLYELKGILKLRKKNIGEKYIIKNPEIKGVYWVIRIVEEGIVRIEEMEIIEE